MDNVEAVAAYAASLQELGSGGSVQRVEVLPFHQLGRDKWHELGETYPLEDTRPRRGSWSSGFGTSSGPAG